jgi:hypothetical protein
MYDSTKDALLHIKKIQHIFANVVIPELSKRAETHDKSKLESPEKETYDKYIPMLQKVKYGTPEYNSIKDEMAEGGVGHHYSVNRHHPEHFENGIKDMTLFDIMEMFFDWYAASLRSDSDFEKGIDMNRNRYGISDDLYQVFINTYNEYLKDKTDEFKNI